MSYVYPNQSPMNGFDVSQFRTLLLAALDNSNTKFIENIVKTIHEKQAEFSGQESHSNDQFWVDNERLLLYTEICFIIFFGDQPEFTDGKRYSLTYADICELHKLALTPNPEVPEDIRRIGGARASMLNKLYENAFNRFDWGHAKAKWDFLCEHPDRTFEAIVIGLMLPDGNIEE